MRLSLLTNRGSIIPDVVFLVVGDPDSQTGGFAYNRRMVEGLERAGISASQLDISGADNDELVAKVQRSRAVVIDSIAFSDARVADRALSGIGRSRGVQTTLVALMHMLPSDLAEGADRSSVAHAEQEVLPRADLVITVSHYLARKLMGSGVREDRVVVIPPGRDGVATFSGSAGASERKFVSIANWSPAKGIDLLIEAYGIASVDATLDLVGEARDDAYRRKIEDSIDRLGLRSQVRISKPVPPSELGAVYEKAYAFLLASRSEGYPTVLAEALNASVPVIAFAIEPVVELVGEAGVLVPPNDVEAFAAEIRWLFSNRSKRDELAKAAGERALAIPTWDESVSSFVEVVRKSLG